MLAHFFNALMFRFKVIGGLMAMVFVISLFSPHHPKRAEPAPAANPWGNGAAQVSQMASGSGLPQAHRRSTYSSGYDSEAELDEEFRRRKLREWREMEERESQGINAPDYHPN